MSSEQIAPLQTPILFMVFNRPDTTSQVFEAIRKARPTRLYVAADGPRPDRNGEAELCAEVRRIATSVDWNCEVQTLLRDKNLGCRSAVSGGITWFFENEEEGIILEDDCLPDPSFFPFCGELLERYRDTPEIMCITGNNFQPDMHGWQHSYYFSIFNHCWGWASWRRAWDLYDTDLAQYEPVKANTLFQSLSIVPGFAEYFIVALDRVKDGSLDTWDYSWTWTCWLNGGLTCTPQTNLISNIGFGADATHTQSPDATVADRPRETLTWPLSHPEKLEAAHAFDDVVSRKIYRIRPAKGSWWLYKKIRRIGGSCLGALSLR
ncbi:MAG: hypothetical protein ACSHXW_09030 [Yoonia sp.]